MVSKEAVGDDLYLSSKGSPKLESLGFRVYGVPVSSTAQNQVQHVQ